MEKTPEQGEIVQLDHLRIDRAAGKVCTCIERHYTLNPESRKVYCVICGAEVDAFDALQRMASIADELNEMIEKAHAHAVMLQKRNRKSEQFKRFEKNSTGKKQMLPICPTCNEPFEFERVTGWINKEIGLKRLERLKGE